MTAPERKWFWPAAAGAVVVLLLVFAPSWWAQLETARLAREPLARLEARARSQPSRAEVRYRLGLAYAREDRHPEAVREFLAALALEPDRADVLNDLGVSYLLQERYYESLLALQGALVARPGYGLAYANLGRLHLATRMPFTATRELEQAARLAPRDVAVLCDLGEAYQRTLNLNAALGAYDRALRLRPGYPLALVGRARALFALTRYDEAEADLRAAVAADPNAAEPSLVLGRLLLERAVTPRQVAAARAELERSAQLDASDPEVHYDLGRVALRERRPRDAVGHFMEALRLSEDHPGAMNQLARALRAAGRTQDARRVEEIFRAMSLRNRETSRLEERLRENPRDWPLATRLVELYIQDGQTAMAALYLQQMERAGVQDPRLPRLRAELSRMEARRAAARAAARRNAPP
jgi:tetratricopeptide (TPR) repeat protein